MPLPPPRDHRISVADAAACTKAHRDKTADTHVGGYFHAAAVRDLLGQKGCVGLRYYHARDKDGGPTLVLVGVDADGNDMAGGKKGEGVVLELALPCPPFCSLGSPLHG